MQANTSDSFSLEDVKLFADHANKHIEAGQFGTFAGFTEEDYDKLEQHAYMLYSKGHYDRARGVVEDLIMMDKRRYYPFLLLGDILVKAGEFEEAEPMLQMASELEADDMDIKVRVGEVKMKNNDPEGALEVFASVMKAAKPSDVAYKRAERLTKTLKTLAAKKGNPVQVA